MKYRRYLPSHEFTSRNSYDTIWDTLHKAGWFSIESAKRVIVTDARLRMSLPVIRSLGKLGLNVVCTDVAAIPEPLSLGFVSKYTKACAHLPAPSQEQDFITALQQLCGDDKPVILPVGTDSVECLCRNQTAVNRFAYTALPDIKSFETANHKDKLMERAGVLGIPCPETTTLAPEESITSLATRIPYPAVIKYRLGELLLLDPKDRYQVVENPEEFIAAFTVMHKKQEYPLVQEYVSGGGFGVSAVFDQNHEPMTVFCHRRLREYPVSGGPSCYCQSDWNEELVGYAVTLLKSLQWTGLAMVEFKGSNEQGYRLMEINPRFWGSFALAPLAGCDMAGSLFRAALGETAKPGLSPDYKLNKKMRFGLQDFLSLSGYMKQVKNPFCYFFQHLGSLLNPTVRGGVFSLDDPKPAFRYLKNALGKRDKIIR